MYCLIVSYSLDAIPPVAIMVSPVIYRASSLARNATIPDISSGTPNLVVKKNP